MMSPSNIKVPGRGFTLTELLVVLGILVLAMGVVLPSIIPLLTTTSATQARAMLSALLGAARGMAIERQRYALVHFQMSPQEECWAAVMGYELVRNGAGQPTGHRFVPAEGYPPRMLPGGIALGEISAAWAAGGFFFPIPNDPTAGAGNRLPHRNFTTFNVVFGPDGSLAETVPHGQPNGGMVAPNIDTTAPAFSGDPNQKIWDASDVTLNENGIRLMVGFVYKDIKNLTDGTYTQAGSRAHYLQNNGEFFCINPYTGQLIANE